MKIVVVDDYQDAFRHSADFAKLAGHEVVALTETETDPDALVRRIGDADALVLIQQRSALPADVVAQLPRLRFISQTGRNTYHVAVDACTERGIVVSAGGAGHPSVIAEFTWGLILAALRHIPREVENLRAGRWQDSVGTAVAGKTLGIYAFGRIGAIVARIGRAFDAKVLCYGREGSMAKAREAGFDTAPSRDAFFAESDIVSLHLPLNAETRGIVTAADLARMKSTSLLVNTSRSPIIAPGALVAGLKAGRPGRAAVDVYDVEPVIDTSDPLIALPNALCTPHLGYVEEGTYAALFAAAIDQLVAFADGRPINVVNPDAVAKA